MLQKVLTRAAIWAHGEQKAWMGGAGGWAVGVVAASSKRSRIVTVAPVCLTVPLFPFNIAHVEQQLCLSYFYFVCFQREQRLHSSCGIS